MVHFLNSRLLVKQQLLQQSAPIPQKLAANLGASIHRQHLSPSCGCFSNTLHVRCGALGCFECVGTNKASYAFHMVDSIGNAMHDALYVGSDFWLV